MKKFVKLFTMFFAVLTVAFLVACNKGPAKYTAQQMAEAVQFPYEQKSLTFRIALEQSVEKVLEGSEEVQKETVTWSSADPRVIVDGYYASFEFDPAKEKTPATITATVKIGEDTGSVDFKFKVCKESNYQEFLDAKEKDAIAVSGYVVRKGEFNPDYKKPDKNPGKASLILADKTGKHYFYSHLASMKPDFYNKLEIGQYVGVTGIKSTRLGHQFDMGANIELLDGEKFTATATPIELTDELIKKENYTAFNAYAPATATLFVTGTPEDYKGQKRKAEVACKIGTLEGTEDVVLMNQDYLFNFDKNKPENNSQALKDIHAALMALQPGDTIKVTGYFAPYKGSTGFYVNETTGLEKQSSNPAYQKVVQQCDDFITLMKKVDNQAAAEYVLTIAEGVTANITLSDTTQQVVTYDAATNKLIVNPTRTETTVTVNAEFSANGIKLSRSFELTVKIPGSKFDEFINSTQGATVKDVTGVVVSAYFAEDTKPDAQGLFQHYAYVVIQDENGGYYVRQQVTDKAEMEKYFQVGFNVTISEGTVTIYKGLYQLELKNLSVVTLGEKGTIPAAKELTEEMIKDPTQLKNLLSSTVTVTGVVTADGKGITVGNTVLSYYADYKICGNAKPAKLVAGSTVTITGVIGSTEDKTTKEQFYQINPLTADSVVVVTPAPTPAA